MTTAMVLDRVVNMLIHSHCLNTQEKLREAGKRVHSRTKLQLVTVNDSS